MSGSTITCEEITFSSDNYKLKGIIHLPAVKNPPVVIGSHGLLSTGSSPKQIALADRCCKNGIAYFRFDHRGCGESQGIFEEVTTLDARCNDLLEAVKIITARNHPGNRIGIFGSSFGGTAAISVATTCHIDSLVTVAAPVNSNSLIDAAEKSLPVSKADDLNNLPLSFYKKNLRFDISDRLSSLKNILIFHGDKDSVVPVSNAEEIFRKAGKPKSLILQKQGDHRMSDKKHQAQFLDEAAGWFKKFLLPEKRMNGRTSM